MKSIHNYIGNYDYYFEKKNILKSEEIENTQKAVDIESSKEDWASWKEEQAKERKKVSDLKKIEEKISETEQTINNLDEKLRVTMRQNIRQLQKQFGITTIYVTHDQEEALTLSDRIAVFNSGVIEQVGTPNEVYNHSATEFVCNFIGDINRLGEGIVNELINMGAPVDPAKHNYIRLERIHVNVQPREGEIALDGTVESLEYYGLYIKYYSKKCCRNYLLSKFS